MPSALTIFFVIAQSRDIFFKYVTFQSQVVLGKNNPTKTLIILLKIGQLLIYKGFRGSSEQNGFN